MAASQHLKQVQVHVWNRSKWRTKYFFPEHFTLRKCFDISTFVPSHNGNKYWTIGNSRGMKLMWSSFLHLVKVNTKMPCGWFFGFACLIKISWFFHSVRGGLKSLLPSRAIATNRPWDFPTLGREMCMEIQIFSEGSPKVGNKTSSLLGYGQLFAEHWLLL